MHIIKWERANTGYPIDYTHSARIALDENTEILIDKLTNGGYRVEAMYQTPCEHGQPGVEVAPLATVELTSIHAAKMIELQRALRTADSLP